MKQSPLTFMLTWLALGMMNACAALTISLDAPVVNAAAGTTLIVTGTFANTDTAAQIFLNNLQVSASSALALQPNVFFANVPGILLPGESYTGPIFSVTLGAGASPADYNATVTVSGGGDIFATGTLATMAFTVLSPAVTISATTPNAAEFGPVSGAFTVSRTGGTGIPLGVSLTIAGTAMNGASCIAIAPSLTLDSGVSSADVAVTPIPNNIADGDRTVVLTLAASANYNPGASVTGTVTIRDKPADQWRLQKFGAAANTPAAADTASWANDGVANVIKYGLGMDPVIGDVWELPAPTVAGGYLTLSFVPNPSATDVQFTVEGCPDLVTWSAGNVEPVTLSNPVPPTRQTFRYRFPVAVIRAAYLRLKIERLP